MKAKKLLVNGKEITITNRWQLRKLLKLPNDQRDEIVLDAGDLGIMATPLLRFALSFKVIKDTHLGELSDRDREVLRVMMEGEQSVKRDKISSSMVGKNRGRVSPRAIWETYAEFVKDYVRVRHLKTRKQQAEELGCSETTLRRYLYYDRYRSKR